jgi:hypothetical protein
VQHCFHKEVPAYYRSDVIVKMVRTPHPNGEITKSDVVANDEVTHFVSMAYSAGHFDVLLFDIEQRHVMVYDGLNTAIRRWVKHISHTLRKNGIKRYDDFPQEQVILDEHHDEVIKLCFESVNKRPWLIQKDPILKQHNGFNCGSIACLKVMEIYRLLPQNSIDTIRHSPYGYRSIVMEYYVAFLEKYDSNIHYLITTTGAKKFNRERIRC